MSKYALEGLTDTLRLELMGTNIHISLIEPGPIESRFRKNALVAFEENISVENSPFENTYKKLVERLKAEGPVVPFTLGPEAVLDKVIHALESKKPKPRYYVTFPTYLFGTLKRVLSDRVMDKVLKKV
jgi:short-subunit dehydrogenase